MTDATAPIGHNNPPEPTPYEAILTDVQDLSETAQGFLDGDPINDQATADMVAKLIDEARKGQKAAEDLRKEEAKPFDDGKKAVQAKWTPITDEKKGKYALIIATAKKALAPWLVKLDAEQEAAREKARQEAAEAARKAIEAERAATASADLAAAENAENLREQADKAARDAAKADKTKAHASGGSRAIGLRTYYTAELVDPVAALKHYKQAQPEALKAWLLDQGQKDVSAGKRAIPGFAIKEDRRAA